MAIRRPKLAVGLSASWPQPLVDRILKQDNLVLNRLTFTLLAICLLPLAAEARLKQPVPDVPSPATVFETVQRGGMSLNQAIESIRRRSDVDRVLSAETKVRNGQEMHHVKYMTKNGTVKTAVIPGRRR